MNFQKLWNKNDPFLHFKYDMIFKYKTTMYQGAYHIYVQDINFTQVNWALIFPELPRFIIICIF